MAIPNKLPFPDDSSITSERDKYLALYDEAGRSTIGNVQFTSVSSGEIYDTTGTAFDNTGNTGMLNLLYYGDTANPSYSQPILEIYSLDVPAYDAIKTEVETNTTNIDITRIAETDTGVADAYVVDTPGTFSRVDGNTFSFIPSNSNTGASTINEDGNGVATIQKYVDGAWAALEEGDINKFQKVDLTWDATEMAFQLAPKGGADLKDFLNPTSIVSGYNNNLPTSSVLNVSNADGGWVVAFTGAPNIRDFKLKVDGGYVYGDAVNSIESSWTMYIMYRFESSFDLESETTLGNIQCAYLLGKELKGAELKIAGRAFTAATFTTRASVSGKGWIWGLNRTDANGPVCRLTVDGVNVMQQTQGFLTDMPLMIYFDTGFEWETDAGDEAGLSYTVL